MKNPWKKISSKIVHRNPWYWIRRDSVIKPDGTKGFYDVVDDYPAVFIVALNQKKEAIFIENYRYPTDMPSLEIPSGGSEGKNILFMAKKELEEETGYKAKKWKLLGKLQSAPGISSEICYVYLATGLHQTYIDKRTEEGIGAVREISFPDIFSHIARGKISNAGVVAALLLVALKLKIIR